MASLQFSQQSCVGSTAPKTGSSVRQCRRPARPLRHQRRQHPTQVQAIADPEVVEALTNQASELFQLASGVGLPCTIQNCGDVVHRSTLDLQLRGEVGGPDWRAFVLLAAVGGYLFAPPGVLPGVIDYYILAKQRLLAGPQFGKDDIILGPKLAAGGFGTVYKGELKQAGGQTIPVIIKKATEFGQAEAWMNERMNRIPGRHAAEFITAFDEIDPNDPSAQAKKKKSPGLSKDGTVWLVWKYEGDNTLFRMMEQKDFPYNLEVPLLGRQLRLPKGPLRQAVTSRTAFKQLLEALAAMHVTGIVHRDIKPQNCIVSDDDKKIKLIDLGGAADLRVGINYAPKEYLLDPRYAPPQQYIMSTQTPNPPPPAVATFLSPVLWNLENPDRFDMWSCGMTLLQMCFASLRNDNNLIAFNKRLETLGYDLNKWRAEEESRKGGMKQDMIDGFAILDLDDKAGWNLLCDLMAFKPRDRLTAAQALQSRFFVEPPAAFEATRTALSSVTKTINKTLDSEVFSTFAQAATGEDRGSLSEAQLRQELGLDEKPEMTTRRASQTIAWWQERQSALRKNIEQRKEGTGGTSGVPVKGAKGGAAARAASAARSPSPFGSADSGLSSMDDGEGKKAGTPGLGELLGGLANGFKASASPGARANGRGANGRAANGRNGSNGLSGDDSDDDVAQPALAAPKAKEGGLKFLNGLLRK